MAMSCVTEKVNDLVLTTRPSWFQALGRAVVEMTPLSLFQLLSPRQSEWQGASSACSIPYVGRLLGLSGMAIEWLWSRTTDATGNREGHLVGQWCKCSSGSWGWTRTKINHAERLGKEVVHCFASSHQNSLEFFFSQFVQLFWEYVPFVYKFFIIWLEHSPGYLDADRER